MRTLGQNPTEDELQNMINETDDDNSGNMNFPEFVNLMIHKLDEVDTEAEIREAFRVFDKNPQGNISCEQLRIILEYIMNTLGCELTHEEIADTIKFVDKNNNGFICYEEFAFIMKPQ